MSTTIDSRVVEMQFDNRHFENNVSTTMSTLDKLKQKLHLDGASKGLENVNTAAKNVNMDGVSSAVDTVQAKFSAMQVVGMTALMNITNSAVNAGKRIVSALTIDPVRSGFSEYEMKMDSIKTIVNSTGRDLEDVNRLLNELNEYSDQTIYSFKDMTSNIGKFTNAGVKLEDAVLAIKGISNEAAVSGANAQEASRAMYNFSQALSSGYVKLIDWKSIENANMATKEFKQELIDTAVELNVLTKSGDMYKTSTGKAFNATKNFNDCLQEQWMTNEVLIQTLGRYADINTDIGKKAFAAAQEVTKLTQMWDVLKETAQSGWARTWELIVGDLNDAKALFTPLTDFFSNIIAGIDDTRNRILEIALDFMAPWTALSEKLKKIKGMLSPITNVIGKLEEYQKIVNDVWLGKYSRRGDDPDRRDLIAEAGYDYRVVQYLVNLGEESWHAGKVYKLSMEEIVAAHEKFGLTVDTTADQTKKATCAFEEFTDEQLKNAGLTEDEIALYRALESESKRLGMSIGDLADEMANNNGRDMLIESFKDIGSVFVDLGKAIKDAWNAIFNPPSAEVLGIRLYGMIKSLKDFAKSIRLTDETTGEFTETGLKIQRVFKGIFAAVDIVVTVLGGPLKIVLKFVTQLLKYLGIGVLDIAAFLGDVIVVIRDWIDNMLDFTRVFDALATPITNSINAFKRWLSFLKQAEDAPSFIAESFMVTFDRACGAIGNFLKNVVNFFKQIPELIASGELLNVIKNFFGKIPQFFSNMFGKLKESPAGPLVEGFRVAGQTIVEIGKRLMDRIKGVLSKAGFKGISQDSIAGLINGFKDGAGKVWTAAVEIVSNLVTKVKEFLGIHSPSKVFFAIGGFVVAGLIAGLQNGIPDSLGAIKDIFQPMLDWIKGIDFGAVVAAVVGVGAVATVKKAFDAFSSIAEGVGNVLGGVGEVLQGTGKVLIKSARPIAKTIKSVSKGIDRLTKGFKNVLDSIAFETKLNALSNLIKTLTLFIAAIIVMTFLDPAKLWNAVGIVLALAAILVLMAFAMNKMETASASWSKGEGLNIEGLKTGMIGIGVALLLVAVVVKMIGDMDPLKALQGFVGLLAMVGILALLFLAFGKLVKGKAIDNIDKFGVAMTKIGIALLLMAYVTGMLGGMDEAKLIQGGLAIAALGGIIVGLMATTKLISGSKNVESIGKTLLKIALAIGVMALVTDMLGGMDQAKLIQGGIAIVAFSGIMVGLMAATKLITGSKHVDTIGGTLLKIALAIGVMALVTGMLGGMDEDKLSRGISAIIIFSGLIIALMAATKLISGSRNITKIGGTLLAISGCIAIMAFTAFLLSAMSWEGFLKGALMITALSGIIVGLIAATKLVGGNADKIGKTILTIVGAIGLLAVIAVLLSLVPEENLKRGLIIVGILSAMMAVLIAVTGLSKDCMGTVIAMAAMIAILAGAVYLLGTLPAESVITSAIALGALALVMSGVLAILMVIGKQQTAAIRGVVALTLMAVPLLAFVGVLALMSGVQNAMANVLALSTLVAVLSVMLIPLAIVGNFAAQALLGVVSLALMAIPLLAFVGVLALMSCVPNATANAEALVNLMTTLGDVLFKLALVAPLAAIGVAALGALIGLMVVLGVFATAVGALVSAFPELKTFLDTGIPIMVQLASGLGQIIGSFITALAGEVMTILPMLGEALSQFMINVLPFIMGTKLIDESVLAGVGILSAAILALTVADLIAGIGTFLSGTSFAELGTQLSAFMVNAMPFIQGASMISEEMLSGVRALAETILILTAANVIDGLTSWLTGGSSLEKFAAQLPTLGTALANFAANLGTFSSEQMATIDCAARAVKSLAQASSEIPGMGGLLSQIVGEQSLGTFADNFPTLGSGLRYFVDNIGIFGEAEIATVNCAAQAVKTLASASKEIPGMGGLIQQIVGEQSLGTFADDFPKLGSGLRGFLDAVGTFSEDEVTTVDCAAQAVKTLASAAAEIPNSGGWVGAIIGENDLGTFAEQFPKLGSGLVDFLDAVGTDFGEDQLKIVSFGADAVKALATAAQSIPAGGGWLQKIIGEQDSLENFAGQFPKVGEGIKGFADALGTFDSKQLMTIRAGISAVTAISELAGTDLSAASSNIGGFSDKLANFGSKIAEFCTELTSVSADTLSAAITNAYRLINLFKSMDGLSLDTVTAFVYSIQEVGYSGLDKLVSTFTSDAAKTSVNEAASGLMSTFIAGLVSKLHDVWTAGSDAGKEAVDGFDSQKDEAGLAGADFGKGLIAGINSQQTQVYWAAYALGKKAVRGEKDGQQSKSPSKATMQAGRWLGEGLIIGMEQMGDKVYRAGSDLGKSATGNISSTIASIASMVDADIDSQPTIRPVLDLTDVKAGAGELNSMFNSRSSIGVLANVGSISSMMNDRGQNGVNNDVVSAINKLSSKMDNLGNTTYQVNGITYDDGSNINSAVETLVRAARIGRRV